MKSYFDHNKALCEVPTWTPHNLPHTKNADGRPVWEPPILDYSGIIGKEYEKKRKAMMEYTENDVVKTTRFMDVDSEYDVLLEFEMWTEDTINSASNLETAAFFYGLYNEIVKDKDDLDDEWVAMDGGCIFENKRDDDDAYSVVSYFRGPHPGDRLSILRQSTLSIQHRRALTILPALNIGGPRNHSLPTTALPFEYFYARPLALQIVALRSQPAEENAQRGQVAQLMSNTAAD